MVVAVVAVGSAAAVAVLEALVVLLPLKLMLLGLCMSFSLLMLSVKLLGLCIWPSAPDIAALSAAADGMSVLAGVDVFSTIVEGERACGVAKGKEAVTAILKQGGMVADDAKTERQWQFRQESCGRGCRVQMT
jgi:hypothetical protein